MVLGLLGLLVLVLGADGFVALCGVVLVVLFGLVFPILIVKRHRQDRRFELRPEVPDFPAVNVAFASGPGRRPKHRSPFSREVLGEKIVLSQPLEIDRWEPVELLTAAHERFKPRPKPNSAR